MDILLAGGPGFFMDSMIDKLNKEGHRVFALSGSTFSRNKYPKVFEQYNFKYDSPVLQEVIESMNPDVAIFMGAHDTNYSDNVEQGEIVSYTTGLINLLMSLSSLHKHIRFLYLSHEKVFQTTHDLPVNEQEEANPNGPWENAVRQGELTTINYREASAIDPVVLRLDHVYGMFKSRADITEPFRTMCSDGIYQDKVIANDNNRLSLLYVRDAVEYIYTMLVAETHEQVLYHLSSEKVYGEGEIANFIAKGLSDERKHVEVETRTLGMPFNLTLSPQRFREEFGGKVFDKPENTVPQVAAHVRKYQKRFFEQIEEQKESAASRFLARLKLLLGVTVPYIETGVMFIPFFMLNNRATGSRFFANLDFLLLYVLLFAIIFGQQQALFAAILATVGYIFRQQYERSSLDVLLDYNTYVWIAQLFILGLVVGYMKDRLKAIRGENQTEQEYLNTRLDDISEINTTNVHIKNILETQLINQNDSFGKVYEITSQLDQYAPEDVLFYAAEVVAKLIHSNDVAIYQVSNRSFARLFAATSAQARVLGASLEYQKLEAMYAEIKEERVFINKTMDTQYPLMADALFSEGEMQLIIMVWGIPWDSMNMSQANMLRITGFLIQNSVLRANRYMEALESQRYLGDTKVLETEAFAGLLRAYMNARNRNLTEFVLLRVDLGEKKWDDASREIVKALRNSDYMGQLSDGEFYVLLSNTSPNNAGFVMNRFDKMGFPSEIQGNMEV